MDEDTIWMVYTWYIPGIYQKSGFQMLESCMPGGRDRHRIGRHPIL